jgi:hypothetical protein
VSNPAFKNRQWGPSFLPKREAHERGIVDVHGKLIVNTSVSKE